MKSCLYSCEVYHKRLRPREHAFTYQYFTFCIDLDEWDEVLKNPLISGHRRGVYSLIQQDHLQFGFRTVKENLAAYLQTQGFERKLGQVLLVTNLRTFGYQFNPVSFYFVHDIEGKPAAVVAEVANTFNEQKLYYIDVTRHRARIRETQPKQFYISPFSDPDTFLHFDLRFPESTLDIHINESDMEGIYFHSGLRGIRKSLTTAQLLTDTLLFPAITLQIMFSIHWHALLLFLKKIPVRSKSYRIEQQTDTRTYLARRPVSDRSLAI